MKCGRCGAETVQRTNRTTGLPFTGCSAWPKCKWSHNPPRREIVGSVEAQRVVTEDDVGDYDERDPMLDSYGDFHDY